MTTIMSPMITRLTIITITPPTIMTTIMGMGMGITTTAAATITTCRPTWAWSSPSG